MLLLSKLIFFADESSPVILIEGSKGEQLVRCGGGGVHQLLLLLRVQAVKLLLTLAAAERTQLAVQPLALTGYQAGQAAQLLSCSLYSTESR
jgi:hypothetical protein